MAIGVNVFVSLSLFGDGSTTHVSIDCKKFLAASDVVGTLVGLNSLQTNIEPAAGIATSISGTIVSIIFVTVLPVGSAGSISFNLEVV